MEDRACAVRTGLYRWASDLRVHGMPTPEELEAQGYVRVAQHPAYTRSWLMWKADHDLC